MRIATFNMHAGVDGWGRPTQAFEGLIGLDPDIAILPETWRGDAGPDFYTELCHRLGGQGEFVQLARAERVHAESGGAFWQPLSAHLMGEQGLYFSEHRPLKPAQLTKRGKSTTLEVGSWGLSVISKFPIRLSETFQLGRLRREKVQRALIIAHLTDPSTGTDFVVAAIHGAHISHGSYRLYRTVREHLATLPPSTPVLFGGDFNAWRPWVRFFFPGWSHLAKHRTWPARFPHSQIDHLLGRGPWMVQESGAKNLGSDHRALYCDLTLQS
ncbi:MAG: endonuclease/exonuclease/phosphatase family protein [Actinomycetota bacterium]